MDIKCCDGGVVLSVKVVPGSSKTAVVGELNGMLKVKLSAPPERGKANRVFGKTIGREEKYY